MRQRKVQRPTVAPTSASSAGASVPIENLGLIEDALAEQAFPGLGHPVPVSGSSRTGADLGLRTTRLCYRRSRLKVRTPRGPRANSMAQLARAPARASARAQFPALTHARCRTFTTPVHKGTVRGVCPADPLGSV